MKVLITGGAGFIGSHVVERLLAVGGWEVTVIDDFNSYYDPGVKRNNLEKVADQVELVQGDICDRDLVDRLFDSHGFDQVIHLAARAGVRPSIQHPELYLRVNIDGTFNLLEAARRNGVKQFVFASSSSVYGINKKVPFSEDDPILRTISSSSGDRV
jgi:UDP-glucuronate 4-epimerase